MPLCHVCPFLNRVKVRNEVITPFHLSSTSFRTPIGALWGQPGFMLESQGNPSALRRVVPPVTGKAGVRCGCITELERGSGTRTAFLSLYMDSESRHGAVIPLLSLAVVLAGGMCFWAASNGGETAAKVGRNTRAGPELSHSLSWRGGHGICESRRALCSLRLKGFCRFFVFFYS